MRSCVLWIVVLASVASHAQEDGAPQGLDWCRPRREAWPADEKSWPARRWFEARLRRPAKAVRLFHATPKVTLGLDPPGTGYSIEVRGYFALHQYDLGWFLFAVPGVIPDGVLNRDYSRRG